MQRCFRRRRGQHVRFSHPIVISLYGIVLYSVVKMPTTCGAGPYARLALLVVNNSLTLPPSLAATKPVDNPIYEMHFDFDFTRL